MEGGKAGSFVTKAAVVGLEAGDQGVALELLLLQLADAPTLRALVEGKLYELGVPVAFCSLEAYDDPVVLR